MTDNPKGATEPLKPCPFCGGDAVASEIGEPTDPNCGGHFIQCTESRCGASTNLRFACGEDPRPLLAEQWNRRATPAPAADTPLTVDHLPGTSGDSVEDGIAHLKAAEMVEPDEPELLQALRAASEWVGGAPHGDNCFVSDHYPGDPGAQCNCGKNSLEEYLDGVIDRAALATQAAQQPKDSGVSPPGPGSTLQPPSSASAAIPDAMTEKLADMRHYLRETAGFASLAPRARENVNTVLELLDELTALEDSPAEKKRLDEIEHAQDRDYWRTERERIDSIDKDDPA